MFKERFGGGIEGQFNIPEKLEGAENWSNLELIERIEKIRESKDPFAGVIAEIFEKIPKIPGDQKKNLSDPLRRIVEEATKRLEKGE